MSTAKVPQETQLDAADFAAILSTTLAMAAEAGLGVGVRNRPAAGGSAAGLLIFIEGLSATPDGRLAADVLAPEGVQGDPDSRANAAVVSGQDA